MCFKFKQGVRALGCQESGRAGEPGAYQHVSLVHGSKSVPSGEGSMRNDGPEEAALDVLDALAAPVAVVHRKQAHEVARLDFLNASGVVVLHVPSAPEGEAVSPLNLDLWAAHRGAHVASINSGRVEWL